MIVNVNYAAAYELPTASGAGNRARFSVGTTLPLHKNLALGVRGERVMLETGESEHGLAYWRDDEGAHHVPKLALEDLLI